MLTIYWLCFAIGGVFVLLAVLGGLDGVDFDTPDFDVHLDTDMEVVDPGDAPRDRWRMKRQTTWGGIIGILSSLKFWTFGVCFFGLTGLVLSNLTVRLPVGMVAIAAVVMGLICGALVSGMLRVLRRRQADSLVRSNDLVGLTGTVELPFDQSSRGKVQLQVKGSRIELIAYTDEPREFRPGDQVLVVGTEQEHLWVVSANSLNQASDLESGTK